MKEGVGGCQEEIVEEEGVMFSEGGSVSNGRRSMGLASLNEGIDDRSGYRCSIRTGYKLYLSKANLMAFLQSIKYVQTRWRKDTVSGLLGLPHTNHSFPISE